VLRMEIWYFVRYREPTDRWAWRSIPADLRLPRSAVPRSQ
jgi:hypothetical protein